MSWFYDVRQGDVLVSTPQRCLRPPQGSVLVYYDDRSPQRSVLVYCEMTGHRRDVLVYYEMTGRRRVVTAEWSPPERCFITSALGTPRVGERGRGGPKKGRPVERRDSAGCFSEGMIQFFIIGRYYIGRTVACAALRSQNLSALVRLTPHTISYIESDIMGDFRGFAAAAVISVVWERRGRWLGTPRICGCSRETTW